MFSQKEKDRRVHAAEKRLAEAESRTKTHRERLEKAETDARTEEKALAWLREAPVTDEEPPAPDEYPHDDL
jgi:hypothetical protein